MNLLSHDGQIDIKEGNALIRFRDETIFVNDYCMDFPGEYESALIFVEIRESQGHLLSIITIDGKTLIYLPPNSTTDSLEILRDVNNKDMVIFPASESLWKTVETWEASVIVPYGEKTGEFLTKLGQTVEKSSSTTIKSADFESEVTRFISLG